MSGQEERFGGLVEAQVMIKQKRNVTGFIFITALQKCLDGSG